MHVRFAAPTFGELDRLRCDALALTFFSDERPLRGAGGLVDWRLCGALSRHLMSGFVTGDVAEQVLVPTQKRLAAEKVFLFGLGPEAALSRELSSARVRHILATIAATGGCTTALVLPGRSTGVVPPVAAMEAFVEASRGLALQDEVVVIETPEGQRDMTPVVERERRRAQAEAYT